MLRTRLLYQKILEVELPNLPETVERSICKSEDFDSIDQVETTTDTLTGRAGLAPFSRYLRNLGLFSGLERLFGSLQTSEKGLPTPTVVRTCSGSLPSAVLLLFGFWTGPTFRWSASTI